MDLQAYFQRIGLPELTADTFTPSLSALRQLHLHHLLSIPFESLSIHIGERIVLDLEWIYQKIVVRNRGGFCYEQNGLFWWVLRELGFRTSILSGEVRNPESGVYGPPYGHMILSVELEGRRWLCDVGFGDGITAPFPLEAGWEEQQVNGAFRLQVEGEDWYLKCRDNDHWRELFKFTLEERGYEDFREMCDYQQTNPSAVFVRKSFCTIHLPRGRLTYMGYRLISTEYTEDGGRVKTTQDLPEEEIPQLLKDKFGIVLTGKLVPKDIVLPYISKE